MGVCLVKPQFEAGREKVGKNGVVRDPATHREVLHNAMGYAAANGFAVRGLDFSPVKGPEGNIEYLMFVQKSDAPAVLEDAVAAQVVEAIPRWTAEFRHIRCTKPKRKGRTA